MAKETPSTKGAKPPETQEERVDNLIEAAAPRVMHREQRIAGAAGTDVAGFDRTYVQRPLSTVPRLEFIRIVGSALDKAMSDGQMSLQQLAEVAGTGMSGGMSTVNIGSADVFIRILSKLAIAAPDLITEVLMLALNVPRMDRPIVEIVFQQPEEEDGTGGLGDDDFFAIAELFVEQNAKTINDFFAKRGVKLVAKAQEALSQTSGS